MGARSRRASAGGSGWRARSWAIAPLVVLDEPTADLDPASVEHVSRAVRRLSAGRTVLLIAHRPELVAHADRIVRLEDGAARRRAGAVGGVTATLGRLLALADAPRPRAALAAALGALTVILGRGPDGDRGVSDLPGLRAPGRSCR